MLFYNIYPFFKKWVSESAAAAKLQINRVFKNDSEICNVSSIFFSLSVKSKAGTTIIVNNY